MVTVMFVKAVEPVVVVVWVMLGFLVKWWTHGGPLHGQGGAADEYLLALAEVAAAEEEVAIGDYSCHYHH